MLSREQLAERVASLLGTHELAEPNFCNCGYYVGVPIAHKWHVADVIAEWVATCH